MARRVRAIQFGVVAAAAVVTVVISAVPTIDLGFRNLRVHVGIETTASVVAILTAYLVYGRLRASELLNDLLLFLGVAGLALASVTSLVLLAVSEEGRTGTWFWAPLAMRLAADSALATAALMPERHLRDRAEARRRAVLGTAAVLVGVGILAVFSSELSTGIDPDLSPAEASRPLIEGSPGLIAAQALMLCLLLAGMLGFARRAERSGDEFLAWVAIALTLSAFARVNYILFPSNFSNWVFIGDLFRLLFFLVMLLGALRLVGAYRQAATEAAVLEERRRIARNLHDGLAQDLAFIYTQGRRLSETEPRAEALVRAADQALAESRGAIVALSRPTDESLATSISRLASMLADRGGVNLRLDLDENVEMPPVARDGVLRIVAEAVNNAIRHGHGSDVNVRMSGDEGLVLQIADDGVGFLDGGAAAGAGFGITSMRERAEQLGGELSINPRPGGGSVVEVRIP